jgi:eRF1 domain 2
LRHTTLGTAQSQCAAQCNSTASAHAPHQEQRTSACVQVPENGLVVYTGTILTDDGKEKKVNIDFEPFKPINTSLYLCDNKFHTEALQELLESDAKYGFIIMDGNGSLYGTLAGNTRTVLHKFSVDLPKKHGRGGQSALRFARLRLEKRHNYVRKVAETAVQMFITDGQRPNVAGLVVAGSAEFKDKLVDSELFDARLKAIVLCVVDVSYGARRTAHLQLGTVVLRMCASQAARIRMLCGTPAVWSWLMGARTGSCLRLSVYVGCLGTQVGRTASAKQ